MDTTQRTAWITSLSPGEKAATHELLWRACYARPNQVQPPGDWGAWIVKAGRGFGKTRVGAEWVMERVRLGIARRIMLIERTPADARETMVEGESGILACCAPHERPEWEPSKARLTWPMYGNARARVFTAAEPEKARGPNVDTIWAEELAAWKAPETWDNALFGLRIGVDPRAIITTTPKPIPLLRKLLKDPTVVVTNGSTWENRANLAPSYFKNVVEPLMGTRLGRRELEGEMLDEADGALWTRADLEQSRRQVAPELKRIIVALDPSVTSTTTSDEFGIVSGGVGIDGRGYLLRDLSGVFTPDAWARRAIAEYDLRDADRIIAEANNGGDLIEFTLRTVRRNIAFKKVHASRGKVTRAEPVAALYEQGRISHVGTFPELEDELCTWVPNSGMPSPNRLDALVWLFTELMVGQHVSFEDLYPAKQPEAAA